ncbi:TonB-dependent siderophore receptor [Sphingosinicella sp. BN140058]|uniref:TonB-dependent receptor plug domain-containing protein n=1 Tax=Sphingosinicella sp. BN140058 TaxID=1892855 RepID=UPI0010112344|nr:TonB-dependent receptor [Sphingosinicella sp. BN140058]QAY79292.1 TonB-dependent receptor [Sphingosinicella sp. BN140058]
MKRVRWCFLPTAALCAVATIAARAEANAGDDLAALSIEELAQLEVRAASKQAEPLSRVATSMFVITDDDIVRSGATSLPEALRLAPNLQVQRNNAREYAITARGFNGVETANKLLVQIDGRTIYTPLHSGVFWEQHAPLLEDLEQIEVISGPGGTLYGPNAVNGVVSITSKDARETTGGLARVTAGPDEQTFALRYGAAIGSDGAVRVYANGFNRDGMTAGPATGDEGDFRGWQAGFRADLGSADSQVTLQGDIYDNDINLFPGEGNRGHNLLVRWTRATGSESAVRVQAYYDDFTRKYLRAVDKLETFDVESQFNTSHGRHELVVGAGLRTTNDLFVNDLNEFRLTPPSKRLWVGNVFLQDRIAASDDLDLIAGVKLEQSSFTGLKWLPNLRLAWHPSERALLWAAISRAVRTPSRIDRELESLPLLATSPDFRSEKLIAFETGYRGQPWAGSSLSLTLFYNRYDDIRTIEFAPNFQTPIRLANSLKGSSWGIEASLTQQILSWWRGSLGVSTLGKNFRLKNGAIDISDRAALGMDPDYQLIARSSMDLGEHVQFDVAMRAVDDSNTTGRGDYVEADARLGWRVSDGLELFVAGSNLLHASHIESSDLPRALRIERNVQAGTRVRF